MDIKKVLSVITVLALFQMPLLLGAESRPIWETIEWPLDDMLAEANKGLALAQYYIGMKYIVGHELEKDINKGIYWLKKSTEGPGLANHDAAEALGEIYREGKIVAKNLGQAFKYYKMAAERLSFDSMGILGMMYAAGEGTKVDLEQAYYWLSAAVPLEHKYEDAWEAIGAKLDPIKAEKIAEEAQEWAENLYWEHESEIYADDEWD